MLRIYGQALPLDVDDAAIFFAAREKSLKFQNVAQFKGIYGFKRITLKPACLRNVFSFPTISS